MKMKASALIIAMTIGLLLSSAVFSMAAIVSMRSQNTTKSIEGDAAYSAAVSGIEDGLLRYKYATANGKAEDAFVSFPENRLAKEPFTRYTLKIVNESVGAAMDSTYYGGWPNVDLSRASVLNADETIDLNLSNLGEGLGKLSSLRVYFSDPYFPSGNTNQKIADSFTALNYRLVNGDSSKSAQAQLISEKTNTQVGLNSINIEKISLCDSSSSCHLRIKPQVVSKSQAFSPESKKLIGAGSDKTGKFIYYVIEAKFEGGGLIRSDAKIGTIRVVSVGKVGQTARKVEATIDSSSGAYLGLFDFGIYCGKECTGT